MKLKVVDRILVVFVGFLVLAIAAFLVLAAVNVLPLGAVSDLVDLIKAYWVNSLIMGIVGAALFVLGICLIAAVSAGPGPTRYVSLKTTDAGGIYASIDTVKQIVTMVVEKCPEVLRHRIVVLCEKDVLDISLILGLKPDCVIPDFSATLQQAVRSTVQTTVGVEVAAVKVTVDSQAAGAKE